MHLSIPRSRYVSVTAKNLFKHNLNYKYISEHTESINKNILARNTAPVDLATFNSKYILLKRASFDLSNLQKKRNGLSQLMKHAANRMDGGLIKDGVNLKNEIIAMQATVDDLEHAVYSIAKLIPNDTHASVPELEQKVISLHNVPPSAAPHPKNADHTALAKRFNLVDFDRAGKVSGSGFYYLLQLGALYELALTRYAVDFYAKRGFEVCLPPDIVRQDVLEGCGFNPRSDDKMTYFVDGEKCLVATAEFPMAAMYADEVVTFESKRFVAQSHCFRAEGLAGALNKGLYRVHQFTKVELFSITRPEDSYAELDMFLKLQIEFFESLGLHFRVLVMPVTDLGNPASIKYDIEAYIPSKESWGEISSSSNCTDYQSRRLNIRGLDHRYVHTVNGTACAVPRMLIALWESCYDENRKSIRIPSVLRPYLFNLEEIVEGQTLTEMLKA